MFTPCGEGEAVVYDKLHDYFDHVPFLQQMQKLAGKAMVPHDTKAASRSTNTAPAFFSSEKTLLTFNEIL